MKKLLSLIALLVAASATNADKPNIIWIFAEDTSPWMGCYGSKANADATPNIDALASDGVLFKRAFVPAPVCSACRSAMMGGRVRFASVRTNIVRGGASPRSIFPKA